MWMLLKRMLVMSVVSGVLALAVRRWPRLTVVQQMLGMQRRSERWSTRLRRALLARRA